MNDRVSLFGFEGVMKNAGCIEGRCYAELLYNIHSRGVEVIHTDGPPLLDADGRMVVNPESVIVITEERIYAGPRFIKDELRERFIADHAFWLYGALRDFDEETERNRLIAL